MRVEADVSVRLYADRVETVKVTHNTDPEWWQAIVRDGTQSLHLFAAGPDGGVVIATKLAAWSAAVKGEGCRDVRGRTAPTGDRPPEARGDVVGASPRAAPEDGAAPRS